jgi:hypothetical protein
LLQLLLCLLNLLVFFLVPSEVVVEVVEVEEVEVVVEVVAVAVVLVLWVRLEQPYPE